MSTIVQRIAGWRWSRVILFLSTYVASVYFVLIGFFVYTVSTGGLTSTTGGMRFRTVHFMLTLPTSLLLESLYQLGILSDELTLVTYIGGPLLNALALVAVIRVAKHSTAKATPTPKE